MNKMTFLSVLGVSFFFIISHFTFAQDYQVSRCKGLQLSKAEAEGRNAWARKCGYISTEVEKFADENASIVVFKNEIAQSQVIEPIQEAAVCVSDMEKSAYCPVRDVHQGNERE